jgi:2-alkyl-3-oxoalkanoate reductase
MTRAVGRRQYPVLGSGTGVMPFIHLDDAAGATALALEHDGPAVSNITDVEPAPMSEGLPALKLARRQAAVPYPGVGREADHG